MPREVVALVSVDDFVNAIRIYSDRVHDLLRRSGIAADEAVEVCESYALALLDAVVNAPESVVDLAGWWFARALELAGSGTVATRDPGEASGSLLAGTQGEGQVRAALSELSQEERAAVTLRDGYDLPAQAVAVALGRGQSAATAITAAGRLHLVAVYDAMEPPDLSGHTGRTTVDVSALSQVADGSLDSPRAAPLRRHAQNCPACETVVEALSKGRRLAAGLPILALPEEARAELLAMVGARAEQVLPSHDDVLRAVDEDHDPAPALSPVLVVAAIVLALVLGIAIALLTRPKELAAAASAPAPAVQPAVVPSFSIGTTGPRPHRSARAGATVSRSPVASSSPTHSRRPASATPSSSRSAPAVAAHIGLSPSSGPAGTEITVSGRGFPPRRSVTVSYAGTASTTTRSDSAGRFTAVVRATGALFGDRVVTARSGPRTANATFRQTL